MINRVLQLNNSQAPRAEFSKPTQSKPNPICDRSGKLEDTERVFVEKGKTSRSQEIDGKRLQEELGSSDRTGKPVKSQDNRVMHAHDRTGELVKSSASTHTVEEFVPAELPNIVALHHLTRTSSTLQQTRRTSTSTSQVCRIRW